jgi:nucleoside-diphosphate-sugar epimerase
MKLRLAITGSSGYLAQLIMTRLGSDSDCEYILGLDVARRVWEVGCEAEFVQFDITTPWETLAELLQRRRINAGLHLAWQFNPIHDRKRHREVDVQGTVNFFRAAEAAGLKRIVYSGSTTAYVNPANPSAPPWISEDTRPTGTPRYLYSKHKGEVDRFAQEFMQGHPEIQVIVFRGAIVLGSHTQNIVSKMMEWPWESFPWMFQVRGADPPMQFISEEDTAAILYRAVKSEMRGVFNFAGDGVLRFSEIVRAGGKKPLALPAPLLYPFTGLLWALRLSPFPAGILDLIRYPWVGDNTRLKTVFGYTLQHTSRQALDAFLEGRAGSRP